VPILNVFNYLKRPEYVFRPRQVLNRFHRMGKDIPATARVSLPWGATIDVRPDDNVGSEIFHYGIFDRIVPEAIFRLADAGELLVEAGANIGQNCSLMVYKAGPGGRVIGFEPHPEIFQELKANAALWSEKVRQNVQLENVALGDTTGEAWLTDGTHFHYNRGTASLSRDDSENPGGRKYRVAVQRLDEYLSAPTAVGVCKIDVEGHELSVLKGAEQALSRRAIRDIIFEDFSPMPSPVVKFLRKHQFTIFQLSASWWRPVLTELAPGVTLPRGFSHNYLATLNVQRTRDRFKSGGWRCLTGRLPL
jgi:FkbM family methyltransferase